MPKLHSMRLSKPNSLSYHLSRWYEKRVKDVLILNTWSARHNTGNKVKSNSSRILRVRLKRIVMKQNITLAIDKQLLKRARTYAAQRRTSVSAMLADELRNIVVRETEYQQARTKALAQLNSPFRLGGGKMPNRESLHDRQNLR